MSTTHTPDRRSGSRLGWALLGLTVTSAVVLSATTAVAATLGTTADPGPLPERPQPPRVPIVHGATPQSEARPTATTPTTTAPAPTTTTAGPTTTAPAPPSSEPVAHDHAAQSSAEPVATTPPAAPTTTAAPAPAPDVPVAAAPAPPTAPAPAACVITYALDGVSPHIAQAAFDAVEAQAGVRFEPAQGAPMVNIRSYWPADNPTAAFGWTGPVHGQLSIYLKPILERTPDFARLMLVHELGHVLGLGHTTSGTPMDDMPQTATFTAAQQAQMVLPC